MDEPALDVVNRGDALDSLASRPFDLLVIGGGIIGAGIASEAAHAGLSVALLDRGDFGSATSSASSKLIHGGLRYLRLGDVRLIREAHDERRLLMSTVAPHLVRPLPFLLPLYERGPYRALTLRAALFVYSKLAHDRAGGVVSVAEARSRVPALRARGLRGCGTYTDAATNDSRLCLANVRAAADAGATVLNYASVTALRIARGRVEGADVDDRVGGATLPVHARAVVNATGPWVDAVRRLEAPRCPPSSRLSKGAHVLVRPREPWLAALTIPHDKVRVSFAVPWEDMLMLGTTDTPYEGEPGDVAVTDEDVDQVLAEASAAVDSDALDRGAVRFAFAGLRVLPGAGADTAASRRETLFLRGPAGMLSVAGGKLTTYRRIALAALDSLRADVALRRLDTAPRPLPGAATAVDERLAHTHPHVDPATRAYLARQYGALAADVLREADGNADLLRPLDPAGPDIAAQVAYARRFEWACTTEDVVRRRTTLAVRGLATPEVVGRVEELLAADVRSTA